MVCDLWYPGSYALIIDEHVERSLGRTLFQRRDGLLGEGTPYVRPM